VGHSIVRQEKGKIGVPDDIKQKPKKEMALDMIKSGHENGLFAFDFVLAVVPLGHDSGFLKNLPEGVNYCAAIHSNEKIFETRPEVSVLVWPGRGKPPKNQKASEKPRETRLLVEEPGTPWMEATFGIGSKGLVAGHEKLPRVWESSGGLPVDMAWPHERRLGDGIVKYSVTNAPADTPPEKFRKLATRRWPIVV
jgi:SRSO17 transposase